MNSGHRGWEASSPLTVSESLNPWPDTLLSTVGPSYPLRDLRRGCGGRGCSPGWLRGALALL